jgi:glutaminyl-tRNA synthetase
MTEANNNENTNNTPKLDFVRQIVADDIKTNKWNATIATRFPPEPNGYLHIGHAKSICLNFGIAQEFEGICNLRFDDTNPEKEEQRYVDSIIEDIKWLGWKWKNLYFASDYFEQMYEFAVQLIKEGKAYVCDLNAEQTRQYRGSLTEPGKPSPYRDRSVDENLELFEKMRKGDCPDGSKTLRAKIDPTHPNLNMRDPVMYRILHANHHRTGDKWCIYPMYDWAHGLEDSVEKITHSVCTLEFENHRPLYDWFLDQLGVHHPQQIEFARLNLTYTVMSKRKLLQLVQQNIVTGWDDPRMPTLSGMRRRGYSAQAIRDFCKTIGVNKFNSTIDFAFLEHCLRNDLNKTSLRRMAVLKPLKVIIDNYPKNDSELLDAINNPEDESAGIRKVPFSRELYIEQDDFMEEPPKKFFRLAPGREVRLRYAYFITCNSITKDDQGNITELHCTYDPATKGGDAPDGRKVKATMHWVSAQHAINAQVNLYDHLFVKENPDQTEEGKDFISNLNPESITIRQNCKLEPSLTETTPGQTVQFERLGYFCKDKDSTAENPVFNRTATLKDTWAKIKKAQKSKKAK